MKIIFGILAAGIIYLLFRMLRFILKGGTFTQPAINTTHLYYQIRRVYDKMDPGCAAYFALHINSSCARAEFSPRLLRRLTGEFSSDDDWKRLCSTYTFMWQELVCHKTIMPRQAVELGLHDMVMKAIDEAAREIKFGSHRHENFLRNLPQSKVLALTIEYENLSSELMPSFRRKYR